MNDIKLRECPFCGKEAMVKFNSTITLVPENKKYLVMCDACGVSTLWHTSKERCVEIWNSRTEEVTFLDNNPEESITLCAKHYSEETTSNKRLDDAKHLSWLLKQNVSLFFRGDFEGSKEAMSLLLLHLKYKSRKL